MASLEEYLIPTLTSCLGNWKRYVDDTHAFVKPKKVEFIFTFELKKNSEINFLDVLPKRCNNNKLKSSAHQKQTNTCIYIKLECTYPNVMENRHTLKPH